MSHIKMQCTWLLTLMKSRCCSKWKRYSFTFPLLNKLSAEDRSFLKQEHEYPYKNVNEHTQSQRKHTMISLASHATQGQGQVTLAGSYLITKNIGEMKYTKKFSYLHSSSKETLSTLHFFWVWLDCFRYYIDICNSRFTQLICKRFHWSTISICRVT